MAKCPNCERSLRHIDVDAVEAKAGRGSAYKAIIFSCPYCSVAFGAQIDPLAVSSDLVTTLKKNLRGT
jgi:hypothetical protein